MSQPEQWKDVVGFKGMYCASDQGHVLSLLTDVILSPIPRGRFYMVHLWNPYTQVNTCQQLARVILAAWLPIPNARECWVRYRDNDPRNCRLENLFWEPRRGDGAPRRKLTSDDVRAIRELWQSDHGATYKSIAATYGVGIGAIGHIIRGETWGDVP